MTFIDLPDIQKIDSYSFMQRNTHINDLFPSLPQFTITHPYKVIETDHKKVSEIIKKFIKSRKTG